MHAILVTVGSLGDTLPFITIGEELLRRGHSVSVVANGRFRELIEGKGFTFLESWSKETWADYMEEQKTWSARQRLKGLAEIQMNQLRVIYDLIADRYVPGETVVAAQGYAFGARIAQEKLGVPTATVHLQPMWFRSIHDPVGIAPWIPLWVPRVLDRIIDFLIDRRLGPRTNQCRHDVGLDEPAQFLMKHWWNSPQLVLGLFPDWFNPPQPDWPPNVVLPGFPLPRPTDDDVTELEEFLAAGTAPIVFSQSSVTTDRDYFTLSAEVAARVGRRAVFLISHPDQVPDGLPGEIRCFSFVPLEHLLPRSALHVHHGGIGTIAHTLKAGIPQLIIPMVNDQKENSARLMRLGFSEVIDRRKYKPHKIAPRILAMLESDEVARRCAEYAQKFDGVDPLTRACEALESLREARPTATADA